MAASPAVRVGIIVFIALVALALVAAFLTDYRLRATGYNVTAVFDNVYGLTPDTEVRLAGVKIGKVESISLDQRNHALVKMKIGEKYEIPEGSAFVLEIGFMIGEKYINIQPNYSTRRHLHNGANVNGVVPPSIEDILPEAQKLLANLNETTEGLNEILLDDQYQASIKRSLANIDSATAKLDKTMSLLQTTMEGQKGNIASIVTNVRDASSSLKGMMTDMEKFEKRGDLKQNIAQTLEAARKSSENLAKISNDLEKVIGDPKFQSDVKDTASEAKQAVVEARETLAKAQDLIDHVGRTFGIGGSGKHKGPLINTRELNIDALVRHEDGTFRGTISTELPTGKDRFLKLGLYDFGADNNLILQTGRAVDSNTDTRIGIYASKLGVGVDHTFSRRVNSSVDLFDPHDPKLNLQAAYALSKDQAILMGIDNLFDQNRFVIGARFTR